MISEAELLKLANQVATRAFTAWLGRGAAKRQRTSTLARLAAEQLASPVQRKKLDNLVDTVGVQVTEQLGSLLSGKFRALPDNEVTAALLAASDALAEVELSDELFMAVDADAEELARHVRGQCPEPVGLATGAIPLYETALDQCCRHLVEVVRYLPAFASRALPELLGRLTTQSGQLGELLARVPRTSLRAPRGTDFDAEFTADYLSHTASTLDKVVLLALGRHEQPKLSLTTAYLSLSVSERLTRRSRSPKHQDWFPRTGGTSTVRAEAAIGTAQQPWVLVLGEAGSGKTTLLHWLAVTAARSGFGEQLDGWNGCVPFVIRLRSFQTADLPVPQDFARHTWAMNADRMPQGWAHRHLEAGTALVLVDGVDEVPAPRRKDVRAWLRDLITTFPRARVVVTTRPAALADQKWLSDEGFTDVSLMPMNADDIRHFVRRWHEAAELSPSLPCPHSELPAAERRLLNQFANRPYLRTLAATPLLCAMLCALNLDHSAELPQNRMELYRRALAMLLDIRDTKRGIPGLLDLKQQYALLGDIAWRLTESGQVEMTEDEAREYIDLKLPSMPNVTEESEAILRHLVVRTGVLRRPVPGKVDFVHRTFQEYLAANEATEQARIPALANNAHLDTWRDTIVMACGHAKRKQVDDLITRLLRRADEEPAKARRLRLLAAACLDTINELDPALNDRLDALIREHLVPPRGIRETKSLAEIGHRVLGYLPSTLEGLSEAAARATVRVAGRSGSNEALPCLARYAQDPRPRVQRELANLWQFFDPQQYAEEVLADAPLDDGRITVEALRLLPHLSHLCHLADLWVYISGLEKVDDLAVLDGVPCLQRLTVGYLDTAVVDLAPLVNHLQLREVFLYHAEEYRELRALAELGNLQALALFQNVAIPDIEFLRKLPTLDELSFDRLMEVRDFAPLQALSKLETLSLWEWPVLATSTGAPWPQVKHLTLGRPAASGSFDQIPHQFPELTYLEVGQAGRLTMSALAGMPLQHLRVQLCGVDDLASLAHLPLKTLELSQLTEEVDLRPLADSTLRLTLYRGDQYVGVDQLGPGVRVKWIG